MTATLVLNLQTTCRVHFNPLPLNCNLVVRLLLSELQAAVTNADDTTFTTVMGKSCCAAGRTKPKDIQNTIKASAEISAAFGNDASKNTGCQESYQESHRSLQRPGCDRML